MSMQIIIGADLVPTESNYELFKLNKIDDLVDDTIKKHLRFADFRIFNLEVPLTDEITPIKKNGPNISAPTSVISGIKSLNPDFFTLANNHILDQGEKGLFSTIDILNKYNISYAGAGKNIKEARKPYIIRSSDMNIGIYCCAEHEFSIADETHAGANPFDPLESFDQILDLKKVCDYVIVLYHGGKEHYRYPSPNLQRVCRKMIDKGADLVVCQHSHCIGCEETWNNGYIIYGQGNFIFDDSNSEYWKTSLLIKVKIDKYKGIELEYIPLLKNKNGVCCASKRESNKIMSEFNERSNNILIDSYVINEYKKFAEEMRVNYLYALSGKTKRNIFFRVIDKIVNHKLSINLLNKRYGDNEKIKLKNYIVCEAHRELMLQALESEH